MNEKTTKLLSKPSNWEIDALLMLTYLYKQLLFAVDCHPCQSSIHHLLLQVMPQPLLFLAASKRRGSTADSSDFSESPKKTVGTPTSERFEEADLAGQPIFHSHIKYQTPQLNIHDHNFEPSEGPSKDPEKTNMNSGFF